MRVEADPEIWVSVGRLMSVQVQSEWLDVPPSMSASRKSWCGIVPSSAGTRRRWTLHPESLGGNLGYPPDSHLVAP